MHPRVHALDLRIDAWIERIRSPQLDPIFYGLSSAADHGLLWLLVGTGRAARHGDPSIALRLGAALGRGSGGAGRRRARAGGGGGWGGGGGGGPPKRGSKKGGFSPGFRPASDHPP